MSNASAPAPIYHLAGVDSGGTNTRITLTGRDGVPRAAPLITGSLSGVLTDDHLRHTFGQILSCIAPAEPAGPCFAWIGCAGYSEENRLRFLRLLRASAGRFEGQIGISNDVTPLLLAHPPGVVMVIAGTGSEVITRSPSGEVIHIGGDEWVAADSGSAFWIGLHGIRAAYEMLDGGPRTALLPALLEHYGPSVPLGEPLARRAAARRIVRHLAEQSVHPKAAIASFARQVTRHAESGDRVAASIVLRAVDELARYAARAYRRLIDLTRPDFIRPSFLLTGGVAHGSAMYAEAFAASLNQLLFDVRAGQGCVVEYAVQADAACDALVLARHLRDRTPAILQHPLCSIVTFPPTGGADGKGRVMA